VQPDRNSIGWRATSVAIVVCLAMATLAVLARSAIDRPPIYDELLHVLAARGIVETGSPTVADGTYQRALVYSRAVAWTFEIRGDDLISARLPALMAGLLLVAVVSGWITLRAGVAPGAVTAIVLAISPITVQMSVFARFYTFHALAIAVAVIAAFEAAAPTRPALSRLLLAGASIAALIAAWQLQEITAIAMLGLGIAGSLTFWMDRRGPGSAVGYGRLVSLMVATLLAIVVIGWFFSRWGSRFLAVSPWAADHALEPQYYLIRAADQLPLLWPLAPGLAILALTRWSRLAAYAAAFFAVCFFFQSIAAQKATRYLFYAWPFLCVVLGCGIATAARSGLHVIRGQRWISRRSGTSAFVVLAAITILMSQEGQRALKWLSGGLRPFDNEAYELDWTEAVQSLASAIDNHQVLVTSNSMKALYYIGDYDFEFNPSVVPETGSGLEFGVDYRTGRPVIGTVESLARVTQDAERVLVLVERKKIASPFFAHTGVVGWLDNNCSELQTVATGPLRAWTCD
jgi:hypothetical protein